MTTLISNTAFTVWRQGYPVLAEDGNRTLLRAVIGYLAGGGDFNTVSFTGAGNGLIQDLFSGADSPSETWTITFTSATDFDVTGSSSGAQASGTIAQNYCTGPTPAVELLSFRIEAGGTPFIAGDEFSFFVGTGVLSGADEQWILDRWSPFTTAGDGFAAMDDQSTAGTSGAPILHGQGNGAEKIYAGIALSETPGSQIWNFVLSGFTGFSAGSNWTGNLGRSTSVYTALWDNDMDFWIVANGRRVVVVAAVSSTMHACYFGYIKPFASPQEWPYPLAVLGEADAPTSWTSTATDFVQAILRHSNTVNGYLRDVAGLWKVVQNLHIQMWPNVTTPFGVESAWATHQTLPSGDQLLMPKTLLQWESANSAIPIDPGNIVYGVLDGCFTVTGFGNSAASLINIDSVDYLVVNDIFRTTRDRFWALKLA